MHNKFLKSEIKTGKITSEFYDENYLEAGPNYILLTLILVESILEKIWKVLPTEFKCVKKKEKKSYQIYFKVNNTSF